MTIESSKIMGGVGAILLIVAAVAFFVQPLLLSIGVIGLILILIALHGLADYYKEKSIFSNALFGFIATIVGAIVTFASFVYLIFYTSFATDLFSIVYPGFNGDWTTLPNLTVSTNLNPADLIPFIGPILAILVIMWIFLVIAAFFTWRSIKGVSSKSSVGLFSTANLLLLIGAFLAIVFIGLILMGVAVLLIAIAFFQIKPQPEQPMSTAASPQPPV